MMCLFADDWDAPGEEIGEFVIDEQQSTFIEVSYFIFWACKMLYPVRKQQSTSIQGSHAQFGDNEMFYSESSEASLTYFNHLVSEALPRDIFGSVMP